MYNFIIKKICLFLNASIHILHANSHKKNTRISQWINNLCILFSKKNKIVNFIFWKVYITNLPVIIEHLLICNMWLMALVNNTSMPHTRTPKKKKVLWADTCHQVTARIHDPQATSTQRYADVMHRNIFKKSLEHKQLPLLWPPTFPFDLPKPNWNSLSLSLFLSLSLSLSPYLPIYSIKCLTLIHTFGENLHFFESWHIREKKCMTRKKVVIFSKNLVLWWGNS